MPRNFVCGLRKIDVVQQPANSPEILVLSQFLGQCAQHGRRQPASSRSAHHRLAVLVALLGGVLGELSLEQLRSIFSGRTTNWKEVGGNDCPVRPITREEGSGTRESFVHLVMGKERISRRALTQESNGAVKELVKGDRAAIGYMSLGLVGSELKALRVEGAEPTARNVLNGTYGLARPFLFVHRGELSARARGFIDFALSDEGQHLLEMEGLVRAR